MQHRQIKDKLQAFYDHDLPAADRTEIKAHLEDCSECRHMVESWQKLANILFKVSEPENSEIFVRKVMIQVAALEGSRSYNFRDCLSRWLAQACALACFLLLLAGYFINESPNLSTESLLLASNDGIEDLAPAPQQDNLMTYVWEDQP